MARRRRLSAPLFEPGPRISRTATSVPTLLVRGRPIRRSSTGNRRTPSHESFPPSRWGAWENPTKLQKWRCFWRRMTPVLPQVSNCSLMVAEGKSDRIGEPTTLERASSERGIHDNNKGDAAGFGGHGNRCPGHEWLFPALAINVRDDVDICVAHVVLDDLRPRILSQHHGGEHSTGAPKT